MQHLHDPMLDYPPHVYYSSSPAGAGGSSPPHVYPAPHSPPGDPNATPQSPYLSDELPTEPNCCDICCPGCSSCLPCLGNCQCCDPRCYSCCKSCWGCAPGGTCFATGACPTVCSGPVGRWSVSLCMQWLSFVFMLVAVPLRHWFQSGGYMGLWTICGYGYEYNIFGNYRCLGLGYRTVIDIVDLDLFQALRAFTILSIVVTLLSAALSTVRLYRQQRQPGVTVRLERWTYGMAVSSLVCLTTAMVLGNITLNSVSMGRMYGDKSPWKAGAGLILLNTAFATMAIAIPLHVITTALYNRSNSATSGVASDVLGAPAAPMSAQQADADGEAIPHGGWASSKLNSGSGVPAATTTTSPAPYASTFSHPSPYQPPNHYLPHPAQYHVSVGALPAAPISMTPQW